MHGPKSRVALPHEVIVMLLLGFALTVPAGAQAPTSQEFDVSAGSTAVQTAPQVVETADGSAVVTWHEDDGSTQTIVGRRFSSAGEPLGAEFQVSQQDTAERHATSSTSDGSFVVAWIASDLSADFGADPHITRARRFASDGSALGGEFDVTSPFDAAGAVDVDVSTGSDGSFVTSWTQGTGGPSYGRRFDSSGTPVGAAFPLPGATLSSASDGSFAVVWREADEIHARPFDSAGAPVGSALTLDSTKTRPSVRPTVDHASDGSFVGTWIFSDGFLDLGARLVDAAGTPVGASFQVNEEEFAWSIEASIDHGDEDGFTVVWTGLDGNTAGIAGRRFEVGGSPLGSEFQINTYTTNVQTKPSIAHTAAGSFVVAWQSRYRDGTEYSIVGRTFCAYTTIGDGDGDGVADNCDVCPGFDDTADEDGDLVPDGCDPCFGIGPDDSDGDGFCDEIVFFDGFESGDSTAWSTVVN